MTVGVYYFTQDIDYREGRYIAGGEGSNFNPTLLPVLPPGRNLALGGDMQHDTWALFWNNDIRIGETVTLTAGIRYTDEDKKAQIIDGENPLNPPPPVPGTCNEVIAFDCNFDNLKATGRI